MLVSLALVLAALPARADTPPAIAPCTVLAFTYTLDGKNPPTAGTMWATTAGDKQVLVTAHSVFGPAGQLPSQLTPADIGKRITSLVARDALTKQRTECARSSKPLVVADAVPAGGGNDASRDVAVFEVSVASGLDRLQAVAPVPLAPLSLAAKAPKIGDRVWLLAPIGGAGGATSSASSGKVVEINAGFLFFQYDDPNLDLAGTIGAPVTDAAGAVVGLNNGSGKMEDGSLIGSATPLDALKKRITDAAAAPAPAPAPPK